MDKQHELKELSKTERQQKLKNFYFKSINNKEKVTRSMLWEYCQTITSCSQRTLSSDLKEIGLKSYGRGDYYQLDIVSDLQEIMKDLNKLLKNVTLYKPLSITNEFTFSDKNKKYNNKVPSLNLYKIIMYTQEEGIQGEMILKRIEALLVEYLLLAKHNYYNKLFYSVEIKSNRLEYTIFTHRNTEVLFSFFYYCKNEISNLAVNDIQIHLYKNLYIQK